MKPVNNYEHYLICPNGSVFNTKTSRYLKHHLNENGYAYVTLTKNNKSKSVAVHRLVALAYIPNPENKPFVNHINANRSDPRVSNLEWCTQSENIKHSYTIGNKSQKKHFNKSELTWLLDEFLKGVTMTELAKINSVGLSRLTINLRNHAIKTGKSQDFEKALENQKRLRNTEANQNKLAPISQFSLDGKFLNNYPSLNAATRALGKGSSGSISNALNINHPQQTAYGFIWKYQ